MWRFEAIRAHADRGREYVTATFGRPSLFVRAALIAGLIVGAILLMVILVPLLLVGGVAFLILGARDMIRGLFRTRGRSLDGRKNVRVIRRE